MMTKHCAQSDSILEHLKKQESMMVAMQAQIVSLTNNMSRAPPTASAELPPAHSATYLRDCPEPTERDFSSELLCQNLVFDPFASN